MVGDVGDVQLHHCFEVSFAPVVLNDGMLADDVTGFLRGVLSGSRLLSDLLCSAPSFRQCHSWIMPKRHSAAIASWGRVRSEERAGPRPGASVTKLGHQAIVEIDPLTLRIECLEQAIAEGLAVVDLASRQCGLLDAGVAHSASGG